MRYWFTQETRSTPYANILALPNLPRLSWCDVLIGKSIETDVAAGDFPCLCVAFAYVAPQPQRATTGTVAMAADRDKRPKLPEDIVRVICLHFCSCPRLYRLQLYRFSLPQSLLGITMTSDDREIRDGRQRQLRSAFYVYKLFCVCLLSFNSGGKKLHCLLPHHNLPLI